MLLKLGDRGTLVSFFQFVLKENNYYTGNIDGIFGNKTKTAVTAFQKALNLEETGIINSGFINELLPYITVPTSIPYTYDITTIVINSLLYKYNFLQVQNLGKSVMKKDINCIKIGNGPNHVLYVGSTHANEWITTPLLLKFIEDFSVAYSNGENIYDKNSRELFNRTTLFIVPLHNPDGIDLVNEAIDENSIEYQNVVEISNNYPNISFPSGWKANITGIDLNLQFPAEWESAKEIKFNQGFTSPAPRDFVGDFPLQAPEALALYDFTISNNFKLMLTFHTQGKVIFWKFLEYNPPNSEIIGKEFARVSGYSLQDTPYASSFAGFKDWFIQNYNLPGYTIECGIGTNPLPITQFDEIYNDVLGIMVLGMTL